MIFERHSSIRKQFSFVMMVTATVVLVLTGVLIFAADVLMFRMATRRDLTSLAKIVGSNSNAALTFGDRDTAIEILNGLQARPSMLSACIYDQSGNLFATYARKGEAAITPELRADGIYVVDGTIRIYQGILLDGERIGTILLVSSLRTLISRIGGNGAIIAAALSLALVVAYLLSRRLHRVISDPIVALAQAAHRVSVDENYSIRVAAPEHTSGNEVGELIAAFNTMLREIHTRDEKLQRHRERLEDGIAARTAELRQANLELTEVSRRSAMILDAAADGIFGLDAAGVVTFINPSAAQMMQRPAHDLLGRDLHQLIHSAGENVAREACAICGTASGARVGKTDFVLSTGGSIPIEYTASAIVSDTGHATGVVVTFRDITARVAVEKMKNEFVSTVSHELRTPLTSIRGSLGLLNSGVLGNVGDRAARMLQVAVNNTDRLVRLINDILDIEKMEAGRMELNRTTVSAQDLIQQAVETMQAMAEPQGVRVVASSSAPAMLWADSDRIMQMLTNLLSNAIKFSPRGTTVTIAGQLEEQAFVFSVTDQGRGIPADKLEVVFERFKQVNASDSRDKGGSGLGLAICRGIVNAHGGRIWAERLEPTGTRFQFSIPFRPLAVALLERSVG